MEFELDGRNFRVEKLSAFDQLHLSRKIAPLLPPLAPIIIKATESTDPLSTNILQLAELAEPFALALAGMKDEDAEAVFSKALVSVKVQTDVQHNVWMPLWIAGSKIAAVAELNDLGKLLPIVIRVIVFNLGNFIDGLLTRREEATPVSSGANSRATKTG